MPTFQVTYTVTISAEDIDEAEIKANDTECDIAGLRYVKGVSSDPYMEEVH